MEKLFILKIGGSVATYKDNTEYTVRTNTLRTIFTELKELLTVKKWNLVIVHGAGGHVHHLAHIHDLKDGTQNDQGKTKGALETQAAAAQLHRDIMNTGKECLLPLLGIQTHDVITQTNNAISQCDIKRISLALYEGGIPVLYGDMVPDTKLGMSICSGDTVVSHLCSLLPTTHLFFATDVNGVYTNDPHINQDAQLVEELTFSKIEKDIYLTDSHNKDMTGGLQGKIKECSELFDTASRLQEIHIFNGLESKNYTKVLLNIPFRHTRILK